MTNAVQDAVAQTQRLRLLVRADGHILTGRADAKWATSVFGASPKDLSQQSVLELVDVLAQDELSGKLCLQQVVL